LIAERGDELNQAGGKWHSEMRRPKEAHVIEMAMGFGVDGIISDYPERV
jgi:hypothetical protein